MIISIRAQNVHGVMTACCLQVLEAVPRTISVPVFKSQKRTIKVPVTSYVDQEITEQVPSFEQQTTVVNVPRTVLEPQIVTNYQHAVTHEPVTVQVPLTQTQVVAQQVNKVVEYQRFPINSYSVAGGYHSISQPIASGSFAPYATAAIPAPFSAAPFPLGGLPAAALPFGAYGGYYGGFGLPFPGGYPLIY